VSRQQRVDLDEMLRAAPLDLGGDVNEQRIIFEEMLAANPIPVDVETSAGSRGAIPVVIIDVAGAGSEKRHSVFPRRRRWPRA
jgi:monoterpene epsilon-lactone hydrolase